jgi:Protein of unknown function (DUF2905)
VQSIGKYFIVFGAAALLAGIILTFFPKLNFFSKLPGDIVLKKENFSLYFPVVTSIVLSVVLTLILWIINYFFKR